MLVDTWKDVPVILREIRLKEAKQRLNNSFIDDQDEAENKEEIVDQILKTARTQGF